MNQKSEARGRLAPLVFGVALAVLCGACGGGGDDAPLSIGCTDLTFTASNVSPVPGDVYFLQTSSSCNTLEVGVFIQDLTGIFTVGFDLNYPDGELDFVMPPTIGPLLIKGSPVNAPIVIVREPTAGTLQVGVSRSSSDGTVDAVGSEMLIQFRFNKRVLGVGVIDFDMSGGSLVTEEVLDDAIPGNALPASFGPGHGGVVVVP